MENKKMIFVIGVLFLLLIALIGALVYWKTNEYVRAFGKENTVKPSPRTDKRLVRISGRLYYDTGEVSRVEGRYGLAEEKITSYVKSGEIPTEEEQANFFGELTYRLGMYDTIDVKIEDEYIVFKPLDQSIDFLDEHFKIELVENKSKKEKLYYQGKNKQTIYLVGYDEVYLVDCNSKISLKEYIEKDYAENMGIDIVTNYIVSKMRYDTGLYDGGTTIYRDGGTTIYRDDGKLTNKKPESRVSNTGFTLIRCNNMNTKNYDVYIGPKDLKMEKGYCGH